MCPVGHPIMVIETDEGAEVVMEKKPQQEEPSKPAAAKAAASTTTKAAAVQHTGDKALSTPPVRKYAKDNGININLIQGTGNNGRVTKQDVELFMKGGALQTPVAASVAPQHKIAPLTGITEEDE